jgi:hypothetical protein
MKSELPPQFGIERRVQRIDRRRGRAELRSAPSVSKRTTQKFSDVFVPPLIFVDLRKPQSFIWGGDAATALPRRLTPCVMRTAEPEIEIRPTGKIGLSEG